LSGAADIRKQFYGESAMRKYALALLIVASPFSALAGELPKEGNYDFISCSSSVNNVITFSKTHTANSYELTGTNRSNPPGGMFDKTTFRCVGASASLDGKVTASTVCEAIDPDGDKYLSRVLTAPDGKTTRTIVAGTGKYEGIVTTQTAFEPLGPFPTIKDGTGQSCNHQTGTYKLK
jgi:hypothetical protein